VTRSSPSVVEGREREQALLLRRRRGWSPAPLDARDAICRAEEAEAARSSLRPPSSSGLDDDEPPELFKDGESSDDSSKHQTIGKISSDPKSCESNWHFGMCPDSNSSDHNSTDSPMTNKRNEDYPKYSVDEFENSEDTMSV